MDSIIRQVADRPDEPEGMTLLRFVVMMDQRLDFVRASNRIMQELRPYINDGAMILLQSATSPDEFFLLGYWPEFSYA